MILQYVEVLDKCQLSAQGKAEKICFDVYGKDEQLMPAEQLMSGPRPADDVLEPESALIEELESLQAFTAAAIVSTSSKVCCSLILL